MFRPLQIFSRARRAAVKRPVPIVAPRVAGAVRVRGRRGCADCANASWRRCATGSNPISAFGVWRNSVRRAVARINRKGETRWHRLASIGRQAIAEKGTS